MKEEGNNPKQLHPLLLLALAAGGDSPDSVIGFQEKHGQGEVTRSDTLPMRTVAYGAGALERSREILTSWGVVLGEPVSGDEIFQYAKLPAGWERRPTSHDMWSEIVDEKGRKRIAVFYKAAFYDRSCFYRLETRIQMQTMWTTKAGELQTVTIRLGQDGPILHSAAGGPQPDFNDVAAMRAWYDENDKVCAKVREWADLNYPGREDPAKYWELEDPK